MRILAIRGKNLASLAGEFEVDFQQEPLVSAGLFAISGPTGAGKSTLLDALCLALYDATPRLLKAGSKGIGLPDVRDEVVTPQDTRTLLRRGAADGYAEVDFIGNDRNSYRARWSVRRSRAKVDGALQAVSMTLKQLPGLHPIGATNREVKSEIERRMGLNFDQFTRAVLLAQNEFSAFLKADDGERGELLQTLTGTAIYTDISRRAYERAKSEQAALQRLTERLADHKPLGDEERIRLESDSLQAAGMVAALDRRKDLLDEQLRWHQTWDRIRQSEQQAQDDCDKLTREQQAAEPRRTYFALVDAVQAARPLLADCERIAADIAACRAAVAHEEAELAKAEQARHAAEQAVASAARALNDAERAQAAAAPDLDRAKALDAQIEALAPSHTEAARLQADAHAAETAARQSLEQNQAQRALALTEQQAIAGWLTEHAYLQTLADSWPRWDMLFTQAAQGAREQTVLEQALATARQNESGRKRLEADASNQLAAAEKILAEAQKRLAAATEQFGKVDLQTLLLRRQALEARHDALNAAQQLWSKLYDDLRLQSELDRNAAQLRETVAQADAALRHISGLLPGASAALNQAERSLKTVQAACGESVEKLRAALEPDTPCPVCGALDHPYTGDNPQLRAMLTALEAEVEYCREHAQRLQQQQAAQNATAEAARKQLDTVARQLHDVTRSIENATLGWNAHPCADEVAGVDVQQRADWFVGQQQAIRAQLQSIGNEEHAARTVAQARDKAQEERDAASGMHASLKDAAITATVASTQAVSELAAATEKYADATRRLDSALAELGNAFNDPKWKQAWHAAPENFHAERKAEIEQWHAQCKARDESDIRLGKLDVEHKSLLDALVRAADESRRASDAYTASATKLDEKQAARKMLFGGKPVSRIQMELTEPVEAAKAALATQSQRAQQYMSDHSRYTEAFVQAKQRLSERIADAETADGRLAAWIDRFNADRAHEATPLDKQRLCKLLEHGPGWIVEERRQLQAIESTLQSAKAVLRERQVQRQCHEELRPASADNVEALKEALDALMTERQDANTHATALQLALAQDNARRQQSTSMLAEIARQEADARLWGQLSELIGSHDGKKFRNYAQQFTLDVLLGYANRHLADLARRYRLERIKDTLALMVVDQDMGDEMRSVHSLSGGESFLVSLALALGLASLSSNRVRVESLFIDEGFGSLDADTLSVAMNALDGLQSMGRKVGVISHVQEMTERIATKILVRRSAGGKSQLSIQ